METPGENIRNYLNADTVVIEEAIEIVRMHHDRPVRADTLRKAEVELFNASKKQIPKKPIEFNGYIDKELVYRTWCCPHCNKSYNRVYEAEYNYCPTCGQRIDWTSSDK